MNKTFKRLYSLVLALVVGLAILPVTVLADGENYNIYGGNSIVGDAENNLMNATYSTATGELTFTAPSSTSVKVSYYESSESSPISFTKNMNHFVCTAFVGDADKNTTYDPYTFDVGEADTGGQETFTYASRNVKDAKVYVKKLADDKFSGYREDKTSKYLWLCFEAASAGGVIKENEKTPSFFVRVGLIKDILNTSRDPRTVTVNYPTETVELAQGSGAATQTLYDSTEFSNIVLNAKTGYTFDEATYSNINNIPLGNSYLKVALSTDKKTLTIYKEESTLSRDIKDVTISTDKFVMNSTNVHIGLVGGEYKVASDSAGSNVQDVSTSDFKTIKLETEIGYVFTDNTTKALNDDLESKNLVAQITGDTGQNNTYLYISQTRMSDLVLPITVSGSTISDTLVSDYVLYQGTSTVGETVESGKNKMNAQYDSKTGILTFNCNRTGGIESIGTNGTRNVYSYLTTDTTKQFVRFNVNVDVVSADGSKTTNIKNFNLGGGEKADTKYASENTINPEIYLKKLLLEQTGLSDTDTVKLTIYACNSIEQIGDAYKFTIDAGTVESILAKATVSVELPKGLKKAEKSGDLTQTVSMGSEFKDIILEIESGYAFTDDSIEKVTAALNDTNLYPVIDSRKTLTIMAQYGNVNVKNATVKADDFALTQTYVMYNDAFSVVGKTGDENKMNAKYDRSSGKLTFDCARTGVLEYYDQNGKRSDYNGFSRFYVTVYESDETGEIEGHGTKLREFNLGTASGAKADPDYASASTINPYINLKKFIQDNGKNLKSTDVIWVKVRACNEEFIGGGNVFFKIKVGKVEDILDEVVPTPTPTPTSSPTAEPTVSPTVEPTVAPTASPTVSPSVEPTTSPTVAPTATPTATAETKKSTTKKSSGWDDGSPFTTDKCGNVFDRWGNKIYEAKGCNVGGYNLVRTSVED